MTTPVIIHHGNCSDGFGSAWLMEQHLGLLNPIHVAGRYGDPLPDAVDDADVFLVDFSYKAPELAELANRAATVTILDHHQTALSEVLRAGYTHYPSVRIWRCANDDLDVVAIIDQDHSGVGIVQQYTGITHEFLDYVERRDLWRFDPDDPFDDVNAVTAYVQSQPFTMDAWDDMAALDIDTLIEHGAQIDRFRRKVIDEIVATAYQDTVCGYEGIWMASSPYMFGSDVAGQLAKRDPGRFAAYYFDYGDRVQWGLRSGPEGMDVEIIAATRNGGGHPHAAGFSL